MQALLGKNYDSFLLTIRSTTVGFYCNGDGKFKIFDSHGRDSYGMPHPQGTRVLLGVNTLNELINYFKVFIKIQMFYLNSKVYILMKSNMTRQIFLINSCQLSPSKQIMQMLKLQPFIFPCYAVVPHLFIAFVFPLSNIVGIGIRRL